MDTRTVSKSSKPKTQTERSFIANKTKSGLVKVEISEYKGKLLLNVRHHYFDKGDGTYKPTPKGVTLPLPLAKSFTLKLRRLLQDAEADGVAGAGGEAPND